MTTRITWVDALRSGLLRIVRWKPSLGVRWTIVVVAAIVFVAATVAAVSELPSIRPDFRWLAVAGLLALFIPVLNAFEYMLAGRWLGIQVRMMDALSVTVLASVANLAPLPGAAMVRAKALLGEGGTASDTVRVLGAIGAGWVAMAVLVAGGTIAVAGRGWAAIAALSASCLGLAVVPVLLPEASRTLKNVVLCLFVELVAVVLQGVRLALILVGIGYEGRLSQTLVLPAAGALGNAAGVIPGGLGLRELLAGALSTLVELPVAQGVTAAATDRVLSLAVLAVAALGLATTLPVPGGGGTKP